MNLLDQLLASANAHVALAQAKATELRAKAAVVARSVVTLLSGLAVLVTTFSADIASVLPEGVATDVGRYSTIAVAWLSAAIVMIRRVTPVAAEERGVLPQ